MYRKENIPFENVPQLSRRDQAYQNGAASLRSFYKYDVSIDSFEEVIENRKKFEIDRVGLVQQLKEQYKDVATSNITQKNIEALSLENTFTVVTAHQPSLLTGPLYFIYKICSALSLAAALNERYAAPYIVPVLIIGGEDHDFEEIASVNLFGNTFTWETDQKGATGRMNLDGLEDILTNIKEKLGGGEYATSLKVMLNHAFAKSVTYGDFMFRLVDQLFNKYGLVIINMDNAKFKKALLPYVLNDVKYKESIKCVTRDQTALEKAGFSAQAHSRKVNLFWHGKDRYRVIPNTDGTYNIGTDNYEERELLKRLESAPESISPNVILRPIYQELILPNLAYIGGGGELAYWLERGSLFAAWEIPFPMLVRRDSVLIVDRKSHDWLNKNQVQISDLFHREEQIIGSYAQKQAEVDLDISEERNAFHALFENLRSLSLKVDATLEKTVLSEEAKAMKSLDYLENKMLKAEKHKNEIAIKKLSKLKQKFFPGNDGLQERTDNFIPYYLKYGTKWIDELLKHLNPLDKNFKILIEK